MHIATNTAAAPVDFLPPRAFLALLIFLSCFAVFFELGRQEVTTDNEGQRTTPPVEMLRSGNFVTPTLNGKIYLAKPPLLYWTIAGVYSVTGVVSEWTARIPTAVCGMVLILCMYLLGRRFVGEAPARWAALAMLASPYFLDRARYTELDVPLTLATFLAVIGMYAAWKSDGSKKLLRIVLAGTALAAATLLKGPVPYLFLACAFLGYCAVEGDNPAAVMRKGLLWTAVAFAIGWVQFLVSYLSAKFGHPYSIPFPAGLTVLCVSWIVLIVRHGGNTLRRSWMPFGLTLLIGIALSAPWAAAVLHQNGWGFIQKLLNSEVLERTHTATSINSGSPFYFLYALPLMLAPWGFLLPVHTSAALWNRADSAYRFCVVGGWLSVALFSLIAGKEYEYVLPIVPILLLPTGYHLAWHLQGSLEGWMRRWAHIWQTMLWILAPIALAGMTLYSAISLQYPLLIAELVLMTAAVVFLTFWTGAQTMLPRLLRVVLCMMLVVLGGLLMRAFHESGVRSPKAVATLCGQLLRAGYPVEATKVYPAFSFYAAHPIPDVYQMLSSHSDLQQDATHTPLYGINQDLSTEEQGEAIRLIKERFRTTKPYFFLIQDRYLLAFADLEAQGVTVVAGPVTDKKLVLLGNADPAELLKNTSTR